MPTGYTAAIAQGITFKEFAVSCASAFGALFEFRDVPLQDLPTTLPEDPHRKKEIAKYKKKLQQLEAMSNEDIQKEINARYKVDLAYHKKSEKEKRDLLKKYKEMLVKINQWKPPTKEHDSLKDFMRQQVELSMIDCRPSTYKPKKETVENYKTERKTDIENSIRYHKTRLKTERKELKKQLNWIVKLKTSLENA